MATEKGLVTVMDLAKASLSATELPLVTATQSETVSLLEKAPEMATDLDSPSARESL
jgi:hypothetical protein